MNLRSEADTEIEYIVAEYGIAHLGGKTRRQRAEELINIAHLDFRAGLRRESN